MTFGFEKYWMRWHAVGQAYAMMVRNELFGAQ